MKTSNLGLIFVSLSLIFLSAHGFSALRNQIDQEEPVVTKFRDYLRINSAHPVPDYESCVAWIRNEAEQIGLDFHMVRFGNGGEPNAFAIWLTWNGTNPELKSILLNSHMDVVAVDERNWDHPPFEAYKDEEGTIFGRGTVDMKSATVGTLEAIRRLKTASFRPLRTIHISVLPDEEITGNFGMRAFVASQEFKGLNVGFDLDEGRTSPTAEMNIWYGEKSIWQFNFTARGMAAHASTLPAITAGQKLQIVIDRLLAYRASQFELLETNPNVTIEDVTSLNMAGLGGGLGNNIIAEELWASFDMRVRLSPGWNYTDVENMLNNIALEAGPNVTISYIAKTVESAVTPIENNIWWTELQIVCKLLNVTCHPGFGSGTTDGKYVRNAGIPAFGVNPYTFTAQLAHQDNEHINEKNFLIGIDRYVKFIQNLASVPASIHP